MTVLLIAGSPSEKSRSAALLDGVQQRLQIRDLSPQALILADFGHRSIS